RGYVLQPTWRVREGRPLVQLFGKLEDGGAFLLEDDRFRPYFFVRASDVAQLAEEKDAVLAATPCTDLARAELVRVELPLPGAVPALRERLAARGVEALEADIRFPYRYLIDHGIRATLVLEGPGEQRAGLRVFRNPQIAPAEWTPRLSVVSLDLETTPDSSRIFSAALVGEGVEEVLLVGDAELPAPARVLPDERALLETLAARLAELDVDVIVGWNVVDFDLRVLARRWRELGVRAPLGRVHGELAFRQDPGFSRQWRADLPGRMALDGIPLVRDALRFEDYRLDTVARALLGRGKLIDEDAPDAALEIERMYREQPERLVAYNLEDARLALEILEREGLLALALERSLLSGMPLDRVGASIASFDRLYLPELRRRGVVAPSVDTERKSAAVRGGAVLESLPGVFRNVAVFDFKSLYPSLIRTFNLDPLAHARADRAARVIAAPNGARFSADEAILPELIAQLAASRERARARGDRHADQAIKIMMNAMFGVLGAAACRFFDPAIANAITGFGQQTLAWTREALAAQGVRTLYGDTDSVFVQLRSAGTADEARAEAEELRAATEAAIAARIRAEYGVESRLVLELERVYEGFFMPRVRGGAEGSKKRYAGWLDGRLELVGLESVRRDWPAVARRLQLGLLERLFTDGDAPGFAREIAARVRAGELDAELVYAKRVRKGSLERYTSTTPPHVQAARKLRADFGGVVRYAICRSGPEPVVPGQPLPPEIDRAHYVERVLRPIADAILSELDSSFDEALGLPRQLSLL
ncbi:MAG TPA: DNA polymerase II, partial [Myxococcota bacterium]|nr:DNA polymerase II [Myxococcota bacterium]